LAEVSLYKVIQEEMSIIWDAILSVIMRKRNVFEHVRTSAGLFESPGLTPSDFSPGVGGSDEE